MAAVEFRSEVVAEGNLLGAGAVAAVALRFSAEFEEAAFNLVAFTKNNHLFFLLLQKHDIGNLSVMLGH
jgi:hypothetical protein